MERKIMPGVFTVQKVAESITYCGLVCCFCHRADQCDGCRSDNNCCGKRLSEKGCFQYECCVSKGIKGCQECEEGPCDKDMFGESHDIRNRTFVKFARQEGGEKLAAYVLQNQEAGIRYGWNWDYDNLGSEKAVMDLLHNGVKSRFYKKR